MIMTPFIATGGCSYITGIINTISVGASFACDKLRLFNNAIFAYLEALIYLDPRGDDGPS